MILVGFQQSTGISLKSYLKFHAMVKNDSKQQSFNTKFRQDETKWIFNIQFTLLMVFFCVGILYL